MADITAFAVNGCLQEILKQEVGGLRVAVCCRYSLSSTF